jgi:hypothetical protein
MEKGGGSYERRMPSMRKWGIFRHPSGGGSKRRLSHEQGLYFLSRVCYIAGMRYGWAAFYLGLDVALIALATFGDDSVGRFAPVLVVAAALAQPILGFAIGSYWALLLPYIPALMALPAGTPDGSEWSYSTSLAFIAAFQAVLMVPGVVARQVRDAPPCNEGSSDPA